MLDNWKRREESIYPAAEETPVTIYRNYDLNEELELAER